MITLRDILECPNHTKIGDGWVPARAKTAANTFLRFRIRDAWRVLTGKCDAFLWPEDEEAA